MSDQDWSTASLDDLFTELSNQAGGQMQFGASSAEHGRRVFARAWMAVEEKVCGDATVRFLVQDPTNAGSDQITLGALLATQLAVAVGSALNVALLVAICTRIGVRALCQERWSAES